MEPGGADAIDTSEDGEAFPMPEIDDDGIDRTQIRRFLRLSPIERVRQLQTVIASIERLRHGVARPRS